HVGHARDLVIAVVRLQHAAVLDGDLFAQHRAQRIDNAALGLRGEIARLHGDAGIERSPEVEHLDLAGLAIERDLGDAGGQRVVLHHGADTERGAVALARPVRHLGNRAQEMLHARYAFRELEAERHRILAEILGDVVDKTLDGEGVVAVADAAPRRQPRAAVLDDVLGELVRNRILRDRRALHHDAVLPWLWVAGDIGQDRFGDDTVMPGDELASVVEAGRDVVRRGRAEFAEGDVVFARPDQLHRLAARLRQTNRVVH